MATFDELPHPSRFPFPPPDTPAVGMARPVIPPSPPERPVAPAIPASTAVPAPPPPAPQLHPSPGLDLDDDSTDFTGELDTLAALAAMSREAMAGSVDARPIDLPAECRSGLLQLLEARAQLWSRMDSMGAELDKFQRLVAKTAGRGQTVVEVSPLTTSGDPEEETRAVSATVEADLTAMQTLAAEVEQRQLSFVAKRRVVGRGKRRKRQISELRRELDGSRQRLRAVVEHGIRVASEASVRLGELIDANAVTIREVERNVARPEHAAWEMGRWLGWEPSAERAAGDIRLGAFTEARTGETLAVPCVTPLIGSGRSLVIASDGEQEREIATELLQSIVVRTAVAFPQQAHFTLLDPSGNGAAFPMNRHLTHATLAGADVRRHLDEVTAHVQRIVSTYLDAKRTSFEELPEEMRLGENYHFVVAAEFPRGYDLRAAEALRHLARTGPRAGVYVIAHLDRDAQRAAPAEFARLELDNALVVDVGAQQVQIGGAAGTISFDTTPAAAIQEAVLHRVAALPPRDRAIQWDELNRLKEGQWWQESSDQLVRAPIGRHGAGEVLDVWFGHDERQLRSCVHGVLGAMPGAGKSTLLHNLILGLAVRYSPEELQLYLVDGKFGVEFRPYRNLPHAQVVSLRTSPTMARSVLDDLVAEMGRRNALFVEHGVVDLSGYRNIGSPAGRLARVLLVVDEYQQLFDGDREGSASGALLRLSQQGRSAGIHFLLASQRFDTASMLQRNEIFGNVHLRMGMQLSQSDAAALTDFGVTGRRLITSHCDRAGRIVVNDRAGDDHANVAAKGALLLPERRDQLIAALARKAARELGELRAPIVIDGSAAPALSDNGQINRLLEFDQWPTPEQLANFGRASIVEDGLGEPDWLDTERPLPLFLGKDLAVRGNTSVVLRRRSSEHLLMLGEPVEPRLGMLASALLSAALTNEPRSLEVRIADPSAEGSPSASALADVARSLGMLGSAIRTDHSAESIDTLIRSVLATVDERRAAAAPAATPAALLVVLHEPERVGALRRIADQYGTTDSELGAALRLILANGPAVGVHILLSTGSLAALRSVLPDRSVQQDFRHRVVLQVPEEDSFVLVRSTAAAGLRAEGDQTETAVRFDAHRQTIVRFRPYSVGTDGLLEDSAKLTEQIAGIVEHLASRHA